MKAITFNDKMANRRASIILLLAIALKSTHTLQNLVEAKAKPAQYITLPPGRYDENPYDIVHNTSNCTTSIETVTMGNREEELTVVTCPNSELLLNGITQANLQDGVSDSDIRTFYTWEDMSLPMGMNEAFVTLQFPNNTITPHRVTLYFLVMRDLRATEPQGVRLYSSTTQSIFPDDEIRDANDNLVTIESGTTNQNEDFEYMRCDLTIPEEEQVPLNYLRIELRFDGMTDWIFISEVEVHHLVEPLPNTTSVQAPTSSVMASPSTTSLSIMVSTATTTSSSIEITTPVLSAMVTMPVVSTTSSLSTGHTSLTPSSPTSTFQTPVFVFPTVNPFVLHLKTARLNVTVNCTVKWDGDSSQLTTVWFYNGTMISDSGKYLITKDQLHIRHIIPQDGGIYECTVKHPSGWNDSREYYISVEDGNLVQEPHTENKSSKDLPLPIMIGAAAGSLLLLLLLCLVVTIGIIVCRRKGKKQGRTRKKSYLVAEEPGTFLHTYVNENSLQQRKGSMDSSYDNVHIDSLTTNTSIKGPPTVPSFPKKFKYSKKVPPPESSKLQGDYGFLGNYKKLKITPSLLMQDQISETHFDIYDYARQTEPKSIPQSPQDIYCKAFDCNRYEKDDNDEIYNLSMCVSIYDNPRPLAETEAPKLVEWGNIKVVAKIGEGQFGDVYLAETSDITKVKQGNTETKYLAAIKTLKGDYTVYLKEQFEKEIKFMSRLDNANVIRLLGICNKGTPFIMMEYMANGDLHMFLKKHYLPENGKDTSEAVIPIDCIILQYVAVQIANGMRYLASHGFIHRDLAARNCLVGEDYIVKIADFGMTQDLYNESYCVMQGKAIVPIRWMAPECFFGKFSTKTDVWSYGVTLWEIFTLCHKQPYHEMSDEQLIIDVQKGCNRTLLKRPQRTPNEFYYVMADCWLYNSKERPDFESVYNRLLNFYMQSNQQ